MVEQSHASKHVPCPYPGPLQRQHGADPSMTPSYLDTPLSTQKWPQIAKYIQYVSMGPS